jgi:hypothetical protein
MSREQSEAVRKMYSCLNEEIERTLVPPIAQKRFLSNNSVNGKIYSIASGI